MSPRVAPDVVVVGSINIDQRLEVAAVPRSGETVAARDLQRSTGGKGANQAATAARLGRGVAMVGAVGTDGDMVLDRLRAEGIDTSAVARTDAPTGTAIVLWERPESTIIVHAGANDAVTDHYVRSHAELLGSARAVMCQLETPLGALEAVVATARGLTVLNPAPARGPLDRELLGGFDLVVPNRFELGNLAGLDTEPRTPEDVAAAVRAIDVPVDWVVTLGSAGAMVFPRDSDGAGIHVPALVVDAVDTTAAGDSFCAGLVDGLLDGLDLVSATRWANAVAARTTTRHGAMDSLPRRDDITSLLSDTTLTEEATQ